MEILIFEFYAFFYIYSKFLNTHNFVAGGRMKV